MSIRFVYFDLGNVLLNFSHERGFDQIAHVTSVTTHRVRSVLLDGGLNRRYELGEISTSAFHQELCSATGSQPALEDVVDAWANIFHTNAQTIALASSLRSAGHRLGILSNTSQAHWLFAQQRFRVLGQIFEQVVTSYGVKSMKPAKKIYDVAARKADVAADELFFVDDRPENVATAVKMGWHAKRFADARRLAAELESLGVQSNW